MLLNTLILVIFEKSVQAGFTRVGHICICMYNWDMIYKNLCNCFSYNASYTTMYGSISSNSCSKSGST